MGLVNPGIPEIFSILYLYKKYKKYYFLYSGM